jgi:hypothetical protein
MYDFDKGDLFIEIGDDGECFKFFDTTRNIYITVGGILRLQITKTEDLMQNHYKFYGSNGMTIVSHMEIIDPSTIGEDND